MNELVSIVIPVYNAEKYLKKALDSCLNQTYSNIEIIAVNDGSTDRTAQILDEYFDKIIVINQKNKGVAGAINTGIRAMNSNLFKLMNADDILYPNCVEILVSELKKINDKKIIICGNYDVIDSENNIIDEYVSINHNSLSNFEQGVVLLNGMFVNCITTIIHKDTFVKYGYYDESKKFAEDYELFLKLILNHGFRCHLIERKIAIYRKHLGQNTEVARNDAPAYSDNLRKYALLQLDSSLRLRYEKDLKIYKKNNKLSLSVRAKTRLKKFTYSILPTPTAKKIVKTYRKLKYKTIDKD